MPWTPGNKASSGVQIEGTRVRLEVDASALNDVLRFLTSFGLQNLISQPPTLEDLFLRHYQTAQPLESCRSDRQTEVSR